MSNTWVKAYDCIIDLNNLCQVHVHEIDDLWYLDASCKRAFAGGMIDKYDSEEEAESAELWLLAALKHEIDVPTWELGRHDAEFRQAYLGKKNEDD